MTVNTKSQSDIPSNASFMPYVLLALRNKGGSASVKSATEEVIRLMNIDKEAAERKRLSGANIVHHRVRWARYYLGETGYIDQRTASGTWTLTPWAMNRVSALDTDEGRAQFIKDTMQEYQILLNVKRRGIARDIQIRHKSTMPSMTEASVGQTTQQDESSEMIPYLPESFEENLAREDLKIVQNMSSPTFKELCFKLLDVTNHEDVRFFEERDTFSGYGYLPDEHHYIKVAFEGRWCADAGTIEQSSVGRLADAMKRMRASNGIFITNSEFAPDAHDVAASHEIKLIDCENVVRLIHEHNIDGSSRSVRYIDRESFGES